MSELQDNLLNIKQEKDTKILPENIKKGITIYNITGTLEGGASNVVKQFNSIQEMQADPSPSDGDLATVYENSQAGITADSEFQIATFPKTVVLSTTFYGYANVSFMAVNQSVTFDSNGSLNMSQFMLSCNTSPGHIEIEYRSSDGLTYTRTRFMKNNQEVSGDEMDFGTIIKYGSRWGGPAFNSVLSNFILIGNTEYSGLYKYSSEDNRYNLAPTSLSANPETVYEGTFYGQNGVQEGNLSNTNNLSIQEVRNRANLYSDLSYLELNENITNLSGAFYGYNNLANVPNFNAFNVTNMANMFRLCYNLTSVPNFNTSNVTNMDSMFYCCRNKLTSVPNFNTSNVTDMSNMFYQCNNLIDVPQFDTINVTNMIFMFRDCHNLIAAPNFDTSNVTSMLQMFTLCYSLIALPNFNTSNVTNMTSMFYNCINLINMPQFNTSNVTNMETMFEYCNNLSDASIQNIINMCLNSNITNSTLKNLSNANIYSPLYHTNITSSRYSNRLTELSSAGWRY